MTGRLRKVTVCNRDIQRKRRVCTNSTVSYWRDEFDCDGNVVQISYGREPSKPNFGISKLEDKVSTGVMVQGLNASVFGG